MVTRTVQSAKTISQIVIIKSKSIGGGYAQRVAGGHGGGLGEGLLEVPDSVEQSGAVCRGSDGEGDEGRTDNFENDLKLLGKLIFELVISQLLLTEHSCSASK